MHLLLGVQNEAVLKDVAFGEVWVCSGQSNMEMRLRDVRNGSVEVERAPSYENIRLMKIVRQVSDQPLEEPLGYETQWSKPEHDFLATGDSFSAVCLLFGEQLYDDFSQLASNPVPIGLIDVSWGGTIIEAWSPPEALEACEVNDNGIGDGPNHNEYLWNAMIHPLLRLSISGVIWYQGEQNAGYPGDYAGHNRDIYDCTFLSMISSWRTRWLTETEGAITDTLPFGFIQLAPFTNQREHLAWPVLRWKQTGGVGYVPNDNMDNVFMASAVDDDIDLHPQNKQLPATRLAWAAMAQVYPEANEMLGRPLLGPVVTRVTASAGNVLLYVEFSQELELMASEEDRFMVCCQETMDQCDNMAYGGEGWQGVSIMSMLTTNIVTVDTSGACSGSGQYSGLAYLWLETPCSAELRCPLYASDQYRLPVTPFRISTNEFNQF